MGEGARSSNEALRGLIIEKLKFAIRWLLRPYFRATASWPKGLAEELRFWDKWLRTRGAGRYRPEEFARLLDPEEPLSGYYRSLIDQLAGSKVRILDVGAGPLTMLGKTHPTKKLEIVPVDVLASEYDALLAKHGIAPPVRTVFAEAEKLTESFPENSFDLVSARNSIDHTHDPLEAIKQMLRCVKENHILAMDHVENEGTNQHYRGLHQWDLTVERAEFLIRGKGRVINVSRELASLGEFKCSRRQGLPTWITVEVRKKPAASRL